MRPWLRKFVGRQELMDDREFCQRHFIKIIDTNKRFSRYQPIRYHNYFTNPQSMDMVDTYNVIPQTERLLTVEIPESELTKLREFEDRVFNQMSTKGHLNMFETIMEQKENEKYLREKYAAVQKAYEHYSMMLKLANSGELDLDA